MKGSNRSDFSQTGYDTCVSLGTLNLQYIKQLKQRSTLYLGLIQSKDFIQATTSRYTKVVEYYSYCSSMERRLLPHRQIQVYVIDTVNHYRYILPAKQLNIHCRTFRKNYKSKNVNSESDSPSQWKCFKLKE